MAHVFIVNENTFNIHLKYMFAGTGAKEFNCNFLRNEEKIECERILTSMIADISRVQEDDDIIFYLQQNNGKEGRFFGSFKIKKTPFLCDGTYLGEELYKKLPFRVEIKEGEVYSKGITERECLDSLKGIKHPSELCWSLIYRKLKGNRGCTMITNYEYEKIMKKIREKNNNNQIYGEAFEYDKLNNIIIDTKKIDTYIGKKESLDIKERLMYKVNKGQSCEPHLQAYIMQNYKEIKDIFVDEIDINWIGNEVSCGVGMQSIDAVFIQENEKEVYIHLCELKDEELYKNQFIENQINKYIEWMKDYIVPTYNKKVILCPVIICKKISEKARKNTRMKDEKLHKELNERFRYESLEHIDISNIKFIEFEIKNNEIKFERNKVYG